MEQRCQEVTQCSVASDRQFNFVVITTWLTYFIIFALASLLNLGGYFVRRCPVLIKTASVIFPNSEPDKMGQVGGQVSICWSFAGFQP